MSGIPAFAAQIPSPLRLGILASLLLVILSAGLLWAAQHQLSQTHRELAATRATAQEQQQRYQKALAESPEIRQTITRFNQLRQRGLIGTENRLDWAKALRTISQSRRIEKFEFTLAPQHALGQFESGGRFIFKASPMQLSMQVLHEGDLLRVLADLRSIPSAIVLPQHCKLGELGGNVTPGNARLLAECALDWITVEAPADTGAARQP